MKVRNIILGLALGVVLAVGVGASAHVSAANGDTPNCKVILAGKRGEGFVKGTNDKGDTVSIGFKIEGDDKCIKDIVFASFIVPHPAGNPFPVEDQVLFDFTRLREITPGTYNMTVNVPKCFYQVDLSLGAKPTGKNGHLPLDEPGSMLNATLGGDGLQCAPPITPTATSTTPTTLVNTGSGNIAGLFAIVTVAGALGYRTVVLRRMR